MSEHDKDPDWVGALRLIVDVGKVIVTITSALLAALAITSRELTTRLSELPTEHSRPVWAYMEWAAAFALVSLTAWLATFFLSTVALERKSAAGRRWYAAARWFALTGLLTLVFSGASFGMFVQGSEQAVRRSSNLPSGSSSSASSKP